MVSAGGLAIIVSILGILVFILVEVAPLLTAARVTVDRKIPLAGAAPGALLSDEHRTHVAALGAEGRVRVIRLSDGQTVATRDLLAEPAELVDLQVPPESSALAASTRDGRVVIAPVTFQITFDAQNRVVSPEISEPVVLEVDPLGRPLQSFAAQIDEEGSATTAAALADGTITVVRRSVTHNEMTGETGEETVRTSAPVSYRVTHLALDADQKNLYGGTAGGEILWWHLEEGQIGPVQAASAGTAPITALALLIGGRSLVVGQGNGTLSVWMPVSKAEDADAASGDERLTRIRDFPPQSGAIRLISPSPRRKGFLALSDRELGLYHSTSHRTLWTGPSPLPGARALGTSPKDDGAFLAGHGTLASLALRNPHPETTWRTLFGKVWYEGYDHADHVWQSTGGSDDFEPKLSLTPLLFGTLKGTLYSLILAIPLGVFGAMYVSQFMHPGYKRYVKPLVEIMASLPSVVLGFLAGLWLAPRIEHAVPSLLLALFVLPVLVLLTGAAWNRLPRTFRGRFPAGTEAFLFVVVLALGIWLCFSLRQPFEHLAFAGDFRSWLLHAVGLSYDQRNALVVGLAMGFAVIPIIFAIAEDAFTNVPQNLVAGSLALGADRWQTVTRVVLPTASPGIFSAVMVGFGRAVGETMIVLMATGNTPIMDWNPFNGFRTLSANIAVEIPEAPHGDTLYRTLFLAALLLFVLTFLVNTVAELVRQRLRERYSQL
ncbi:MAG TPA: ABC transporter permease [Acidobacteria bacterium]|nr:ABC transporter permease [Acidobacteriota bacterium]